MNEIMPFVSVLVPVYGVEKYIKRCAISLFEQTYENLEYIFVDDCTPDKSIQIIQQVLAEYPKREKQTRIIHHNKNRGIAATRNTAVKNCTGGFLTFVDSDDYLEKDAVEKLINKQKETGADIVTGMAIIHNNGKLYEMRNDEPKERMELIKFYIQIGTYKMLWGRLIKTSLYTDNMIQCIDGCNWCDDIQVLSRLYYVAKSVTSINNVVYHYDFCHNSESYTSLLSSSQRFPQQVLQRIESFEVLRYFYKSHNDEEIVNCVEKNLALFLFEIAPMHAKYRQKKMFSFVWKVYDLIDKNNKKDLQGYREKFLWLVNRRYYLCKLYYSAKPFLRKLLQSIKNK